PPGSRAGRSGAQRSPRRRRSQGRWSGPGNTSRILTTLGAGGNRFDGCSPPLVQCVSGAMLLSEGESVTESERMNLQRPAWRHRLFLLAVALAAIGADQLTKIAVERALPLNASWTPLEGIAPFFRFTHVSNTGAAFGLFPTGSLLFAVVALVVGAIILVYNFRLPAGNLLLRLALGLQLGGALGNLVDRLRLGHVTDFL